MRTIYLDLDLEDHTSIAAGDVLHTTPRSERGRESWHRIKDAWPTESRIWPNRWTLKVGDRSYRYLRPEAGGVTHSCGTYTPGEGPHDYFDVDP